MGRTVHISFSDGRLSVVLNGEGLEHSFHSTMCSQYTRLSPAIEVLLNPSEDATSQNQQLSSFSLEEII